MIYDAECLHAQASGAFYIVGAGNTGKNYRSPGQGTGNIYRYFDANRSDSVYGMSKTIQNAAINVIPIIKY